jgi:hypothetical protein
MCGAACPAGAVDGDYVAARDISLSRCLGAAAPGAETVAISESPTCRSGPGGVARFYEITREARDVQELYAMTATTVTSN